MGEQGGRVPVPDDVLTQEGKSCVLNSRPMRDHAMYRASPSLRPRSPESEFDEVSPSHIPIQLRVTKSSDEAMGVLHWPLKPDQL